MLKYSNIKYKYKYEIMVNSIQQWIIQPIGYTFTKTCPMPRR